MLKATAQSVLRSCGLRAWGLVALHAIARGRVNVIHLGVLLEHALPGQLFDNDRIS